MKVELLAPAGNIESLKAAIHNGADAVYLAGKSFGARNYAENFSNEEIVSSIKYAHLYDVKVYVTANTLIFEDEVSDFINYIKFLYLSGVDAVIMQDIGMISLVRKLIPDLEIHASTQCHTINDETLQLFKDLGVTRAVLARELSLDEVKSLSVPIEKEIFIHGALCISYSGQCLFSSLNGGRSGNRGRCAGPCRLPYSLIKNDKVIKTDGKFLLSTKELNTALHIKDILSSGVSSLKIEGRMKSPEYVGFVTRMYRKLIDDNDAGFDSKNLKKLFNRGFTSGHLFGNCGSDLMNIKSSNHIGYPLGKVMSISSQIKIKLSDDISQNDGIRFMESGKGMVINKLYKDGLLVNFAKAGEVICVDNKVNLKSLDSVYKTTDYVLMNELRNYPLRKIPLSFDVYARKNERLRVRAICGDIVLSVSGEVIAESISRPITKDNISKQLSKLGNTPFVIDNISIDMDDDIFISLRELNELRRKLVDMIIDEKTKVSRTVNFSIPKASRYLNEKILINASVSNEEQLLCLLGKVDYIYTSNYGLYLKYKEKGVFYRLDRALGKLSDMENENLVISSLGGVYKYGSNKCFGDYFLNVTNSYSAQFLRDMGIKNVTLSPELSVSSLINILRNTCGEVIVYGFLELMIMKHCIIKMCDGCLCRENKYFLMNNEGKKFRIVVRGCRTIIMHHEPINLISDINKLKEYSPNFRLEFFDESASEVLDILEQVKSQL